MPCGFCDFTSAQSQPDGIKLLRILQRKVGGPPRIVLDELNRDFCRITSFVNEFDGFSDHYIFRLIYRSNGAHGLPHSAASLAPVLFLGLPAARFSTGSKNLPV
jgi:hypothetical protein